MRLLRLPFTAMGSPCELQLYGADEARTRTLAADARREIERLEQRYSRYRDDSLLAEINRRAAVGGRIDVDAETAGLIDYADTCHRESDGLFDISSGLLRQAWRFRERALPTPAAIEALLDRIGWSKVHWRRPTLEFPAGMELDLGGIVKEYAADRVASLLLAAGCRHGFVNLGGDIRVLGPHADGRPWEIGIRDPRNGGVLRQLSLARGAVTTSGDYERCIELDGRRYGHVLNPRTGWPVAHLASVTVIAELCVVAGSASTIAMLKEAAGPAWLEALGLPHLWVDVAGRVGGSMA